MKAGLRRSIAAFPAGRKMQSPCLRRRPVAFGRAIA
jgi:hypothetical protein